MKIALASVVNKLSAPEYDSIVTKILDKLVSNIHLCSIEAMIFVSKALLMQGSAHAEKMLQSVFAQLKQIERNRGQNLANSFCYLLSEDEILNSKSDCKSKVSQLQNSHIMSLDNFVTRWC